VLSAPEAATLEAWSEALIPADQDPGARQAGVVFFIDRQLVRKYKKHLPAYQHSLEAIDRLAQQRHKQPFAELELEQATAVLQTLEAGQAPKDLWPDGGKAAFEMVLAHSLQGFYGNPRHGGNRDYASWKMIGVPAVQVRGRQHYVVAATYPEKS
jgi:gluconate 2-dehydrogenase gamma chain